MAIRRAAGVVTCRIRAVDRCLVSQAMGFLRAGARCVGRVRVRARVRAAARRWTLLALCPRLRAQAGDERLVLLCCAGVCSGGFWTVWGWLGVYVCMHGDHGIVVEFVD